MKRSHGLGLILLLIVVTSSMSMTPTSDQRSQDPPAVQPSIDVRFADTDVMEVPDFQKHVIPLFSRLGCNGRACHGSFQGQGGFQLSLFGYDFAADYAALHDAGTGRIDLEAATDSLILHKPTTPDDHGGGQRFEMDSWQYRIVKRWIEAGAKRSERIHQLDRLDVKPDEIVFTGDNQTRPLQVTAIWQDGSREDVTVLSRFRSNNDQYAQVDSDGMVRSGQAGDTHVIVFYDNAVVAVPVMRPLAAATTSPRTPTPTTIDELVVAKLNKLGITQSDLADDATFLRRVSLDITGTLPTPEEVVAFLKDPSANKRQEKTDELLQRDAYAAWWTTKLCDFTGNNTAQLVNALPVRDRARASQDWYDWIYKRVSDNTPYDELVAGIVTAVSRSEGESYAEYSEQMSAIYRGDSEQSYADLPYLTHYWARRDFRDPQTRAISFAYAFAGVRIQCAQCHKHPFDQWSKQDFEQFTSFFRPVVFENRVRNRQDRKDLEEIVKNLDVKGKRGNQLRREFATQLQQGKTVPFPQVVVRQQRRAGNRNRNRQQESNQARLLGGQVVDLSQVEDPRTMLMSWLTDRQDAYLARALVNRVWAHYFGVGIVDPPDDLSLANPPSNQPLLDYLTFEFIRQGYDMKWLHREITNSRTYQLSWKTNETNAGDQRNFSHAYPRRLPAEVAYDAIVQATASDTQAVKLTRQLDGRAIATAGTANRGRRDRGRTFALRVFGRSTRESNCDCDRTEDVSLLQTIYLQNDAEVLQMIDRRQDGWIAQLSGAATPQADRASSGRLRQLNNQISRLKKRLKSIDRNQNRQQFQRQSRRLQQLQREAETLRQQRAERERPPAWDTEEMVRQAYLKSLSRLPNQQELKRSVQYVEADSDRVNGMRGLLWALINTKEFIVNH